MVAVMGPSGCGKTTLLNCLSGIDDVTSGQVLIEGTDISTLDDNTKTSYRARRMGFIFQFYNLLPVLTAVENVELPLLVSGTSPKESRERANSALRRVHLEEWGTHKPAQLSGGQRQRVTIARALVNEPAIVWAGDRGRHHEPDAAAEPGARAHVHDRDPRREHWGALPSHHPDARRFDRARSCERGGERWISSSASHSTASWWRC
jgi:putative ABC transport system ATP-binding protein